MEQVDLSNVDLNDVNSRGIYLINTNLRGANLRITNLGWVKWHVTRDLKVYKEHLIEDRGEGWEMIKYRESILKPVKFKYFQITRYLFNELVKDTKKAELKDQPSEKPINQWKVIKQYRGLVCDDFGIHFYQDYGTTNQISAGNVDIGDYIVESPDGHTKLIKEADFNKYFCILKDNKND